MNMRHSFPDAKFNDDVGAEINRIQAIWRDTQRRFGVATGEGPYLMGSFSALDAMLAPVAARFGSYSVDLEAQAQAYVDAVATHPFMIEWRDAAQLEPWILPEFEYDAVIP